MILFKRPQQVQIGYDLLTKAEKTKAYKQLKIAYPERLERESLTAEQIWSIIPIWGGVAAQIEFSNGATVRLTSRSFWADSPVVAAVKAITCIGTTAQQREARNLAAKQQATAEALRVAIESRRYRATVTQQAVAV